MALGNIVSLSGLLDLHPGLNGGLQQAAISERLSVQAEFFHFQEIFSGQYFVVMDGEKVDPMTQLFDPFLLHIIITLSQIQEDYGQHI